MRAVVWPICREVGEVHGVVVHHRDAPHARGRKVKGGGATQAARANDQRMGIEEALLPFHPQVIEQHMARIPQ